MQTDPFLLFEFHHRQEAPGPLCFRDPVDIITTTDTGEVRAALEAVQRGVDMGLYAAGYVGYEAAPAFDPAFVVRPGAKMPLLWFGLFRNPVPLPSNYVPGDFHLALWRPTTSRHEYEADIAGIRAAIERGETYQVNYTMRLRADFAGDDFALYRHLGRRQPRAYRAYLNLGQYRILSASPELFFQRLGDYVVTRPMKGTARRGRWEQEDIAQAEWLAHSEKNRAENLMIVDLLRNDLGRISRRGSVEVPRLFEVERYPTVFQMTSTITSTLQPGTTLEALFGALFPCGSITGAPKVSTMRHIAMLEETPREIYCGAIGLVQPGGDALFNVAIRTVWIDTEEGRAEYGVGGGVTWDSTAEEEYAEALVKARLLTEERSRFSLLETMRLEQGNYFLLEQHLDRLASSARYFDIPLAISEVRSTLAQHASAWPRARRRVRLLVSQEGGLQVQSSPLEPFSNEPLVVTLAEEPVPSNDPFLFHKTTHRVRYERHRAAQPDLFDVLLWNESGELTEFTIGNVVLELDGERWTPPVESGLLAGTFRAHLLEQGAIQERLLHIEDLKHATAVWLINSVRGWVRVRMRQIEGADESSAASRCAATNRVPPTAIT